MGGKGHPRGESLLPPWRLNGVKSKEKKHLLRFSGREHPNADEVEQRAGNSNGRGISGSWSVSSEPPDNLSTSTKSWRYRGAVLAGRIHVPGCLGRRNALILSGLILHASAS